MQTKQQVDKTFKFMHSTRTTATTTKNYNKLNKCDHKKFAFHNRLSKDDKYLKRKGSSNNYMNIKQR